MKLVLSKAHSKVKVFTRDWAKADKAHFADGGSFDQIYTNK